MKKDLNTAFLGHPKPLFSLSFTELWERFSFYGIRPLLVLFMAAALLDGGLGFSKEHAAAIAGIFGGCIYLAALPGGWIADNYLGQKKAVFYGAIIIALGHLFIALSYFYTSFFFLGLSFIVIGTGLFKTCASVMVGMLYKEEDSRRDSGFTIFYMGINIGAFIAPLVTGFLQVSYGYHLGFGAGGIGMLIALAIFYFKTLPDFKEFDEKIGIEYAWDKPLKRNKNTFYFIIAFFVLFAFAFFLFNNFISLNPVIIAQNIVFVILWCAGIYFLYLFFFSALNKEEKKKLFVFVILFFASAIFWSIYEQQYTTHNFFADKLTERMFFNYEIPTAWFQAISALFIILLAPLMSMLWIFLARKNKELSSLSKFALGLVGAGISFVIMALASEHFISLNDGVINAQVAVNNAAAVLISPWWLVVSFFFLVLGELCLSPVGLSIMTKIAPNLIKSQVMGLWFVSISLGNVIAGLIGGRANDENLSGLSDLLYECVIILFIAAAFLFIFKKLIHKIAHNV